jgi:hypothetical protein
MVSAVIKAVGDGMDGKSLSFNRPTTNGGAQVSPPFL